MPQGKSYAGSFQSQELQGAEYEVKLQTESDAQYADIFAAESFSITAAERAVTQENTLNAGTKTNVGAAGQVTASGTCLLYTSPSPRD